MSSTAHEDRPARTVADLRPGDVLLLGRLSLQCPRRARPFLTISAPCRRCRTTHSHGWTRPPGAMDAVSHKTAHCHNGGGGYYVGLDQAAEDHNRRVLADYAEALRRWERQQQDQAAASA